MNQSTQYISEQKLLNLVKHHQVAWQEYDSLIMFTRDEYPCNDANQEEVDEYEMNRNEELFKILSSSTECKIFNPLEDETDGFTDLLSWSKSEDLLILVDNQILLCVAPCDKELLRS